MSYEQPTRITYSIPAITLSTTDATRIIRGPKGKRGRLVDVIASITTTTAGATTTPKVQVGKSGALTESCDLDVGAVTAPGAIVASAVAAGNGLKRDASNIQPTMDADTDVYVTLKAASGSGAAGVLDTYVVIDWF